MVIGPGGEPVGPVIQETEGILYQDIDINHCVGPKQFHDVVGYYNRFDVFELQVNRTRLRPISFAGGRDSAESLPKESAGESAQQQAGPSLTLK